MARALSSRANPAADVTDDLHRVERDQAVANEFFELGEERPDLFVGVDDDHHGGKIVRSVGSRPV